MNVKMFLANLLTQIDGENLDTSVGSKEKVVLGEKYVCVIEDNNLKRLIVFFWRKLEEFNKKREENADRLKAISEKEEITPEESAFMAEYLYAKREKNLLEAIVWFVIDGTFLELLLTDEAKGIREGWQVVTYNLPHACCRAEPCGDCHHPTGNATWLELD